MFHCMWVVGLRVRRRQRPGEGAVTKTLCPSGLRGWTQVPLARAAWVQIPQVSLSCRLPCAVLGLCLAGCPFIWDRAPVMTFAMGSATPVGFEPTRGDPIGLAGRRLNHSAKVSLYTFDRLRLVCVCVCVCVCVLVSVAGGGCAIVWRWVPVVSGCGR